MILSQGRPSWRARISILAAVGFAAPALLVQVAVPASAQDTPGTRPTAARRAGLSATDGPGGLHVVVNQRGKVSRSIVGMVAGDASESFAVNKPAGGKVRGAYLATATTGFWAEPLTVPVTIDGHSVPLTGEIPSGIESYNYFADVTSLVKGKLDTASPGLVAFQYGEPEPWNTDGSILEVIYDDPSVTVDQSVTILYGALKSTGDTYDVKLAAPITLGDAATKLEMSLGISFSYQGNGTQQFSTVDVNGSRLTSAAGGEDDGRAQNGALLTVGGDGDSSSNPTDPYAAPTNAASDDELYDLRPFVKDGDTHIRVDTNNPSQDDNVFLSTFTTNPPVASVSTGTPGFVYIALGDSYQSGEGAASSIRPQSDYLTTGYENGSNYPSAVGPQENTFSDKVIGSGVPSGGNGCHRALMNYAKINRDKLEPGKDVILIDRTCSGAQIQPSTESGGKPPIVGATGQGIDPGSQMQQALDMLSAQGISPDDVDLVTVGMGGNDAKFGDILTSCIAPALLEAALRRYPNTPSEIGWVAQQASCELVDNYQFHTAQAIKDLKPKVLDAQTTLLKTFKTARILQLDYPNILPSKDAPSWCGGLRGSDVSYARAKVLAIDSVVRDAVKATAAADPRLELVDVQGAFGPNALCPGGGDRLLANGLNQANFDTEVTRLLNLDGNGDAGARQRLDAVVTAYNDMKACLANQANIFDHSSCDVTNARNKVGDKAKDVMRYLTDEAPVIFGNMMSPPGTSDDTNEVAFDRSRGLFHPNADGFRIQACAVLRVYQWQGDPASCYSGTASGPSTVNGNPLGHAPVDVSVGDLLRLVVEYFRPGSPVHLWLYSQPKDLGNVTADSSGSVQTTVVVPDVNPGVHQLELQGEGAGGVQVTKQVLIRVAGRPSGDYTTYLCCFQPQPETVTADTVTETVSVTVGGINIGDFPTDPDGGVLVRIPTVDRLRNTGPLVIEGTSSVTGKIVRELVSPIPTAPSLWATSTAADAISVTGARFAADGRVHSEGGIFVRGTGQVLTGGVEYGTVLDSAGGPKTITPAALRTQTGDGGPAVPQMNQYRPGGAASHSGAPYIAVSRIDCVNGAWTPPTGMMLTGVVYVPCAVSLTGSGTFGATFAAEGPITVSGSRATVGQDLPAGAGQPSLVTAASGADGIRVTGADVTLVGQALAPAGQVRVSGARVALVCGAVASSITVSGADSAARMSARCLTS